MIVVTGPRSPNAGMLVPMSFDTAIAGSGIVALTISGDAAAPLFTAANKQLEAVQKELDGGNPHVAGFAIPDLQLRLSAQIVREQQTGNNIVGYLPATTATTAVSKPWIAVGAHYDHLGRGGAGIRLPTSRTPTRSPWRRRQCIRHGDRAHIGDALAKQPASAISCSRSGRAKSLACSGRMRLSRSHQCRSTVAAYLNSTWSAASR